MKRRLFLKRAALVLAAPAVIRVAQLMPISVPPQLNYHYGPPFIIRRPEDFTVRFYDIARDVFVEVPATEETYNAYIRSTGGVLVDCIPQLYA